MKKYVLILIALLCLFSFSACEEYKSQNTKKDPINIDFGKKTTAAATEEATPAPTATPIPEPTHSGGYSEEELASSAPAICVIDTETGEVVYKTDNYQEEKYIASITKLITALTALDYLDISETVTIKASWLKLLDTDRSIDKFGLKAGNKINVGDLFGLMLVKSYGDAAEVLRYLTEEKTGKDFLVLMNEKARSIGMTMSHFDNTIGLDIGNNFTENYSTAFDVALLLEEAMKSDVIRYYASGKSIKLKNGTTLDSTNSILHNGTKTSAFTVVCGKTGVTRAAANTLAVGFKDETTGKEYAAVYIHAKDWASLNSELLYTMNYVLQEMNKSN